VPILTCEVSSDRRAPVAGVDLCLRWSSPAPQVGDGHPGSPRSAWSRSWTRSPVAS